MSGRGEFDWIRSRLVPLTRNHAAARGLADDAAVLDCPPGHELVIACDTLVEGVHFLPGDTPHTVAARALGSNLSDLAAMGADPLGYLSAISWPQDRSEAWQNEFTQALGEIQDRYGVVLLGGDTTRTPGPLTLSLTLIGQVATGAALSRSGAQPGDVVWVSGSIGDAALGLAWEQGDASLPAETAHRYREPEPRLAVGQGLAGLASAALDVSDGLVADAGHLAAASRVGIEIDLPAVPLSATCEAWVSGQGDAGLIRLITGGDDYELLFTAPVSATPRILALGELCGVRLTQIGRAVSGQGVVCRDGEGRAVPVATPGFTHF
ncbi:thiamine-phosphate kinase [Maricaulis parjimensis]|uniref:thiamine-phosphate kinase n=1 Tax=Maricaulis parjimensis TaxID=144023 RepID=UPI001939B1AB|nr:thiamine-phosphate kinase [Maricaulis parjimensis]